MTGYTKGPGRDGRDARPGGREPRKTGGREPRKNDGRGPQKNGGRGPERSGRPRPAPKFLSDTNTPDEVPRGAPEDDLAKQKASRPRGGRDEAPRRDGPPNGRGRDEDRGGNRRDARPERNGRDRSDGRPSRPARDRAETRERGHNKARNGPRDAVRKDDRHDDQSEKPRPEFRREKRNDPPGMPARRAALDILQLVGPETTLDEALNECRSFNALEGADRGFARLIATSVLRRRGALDHVIGEYVDRPLPGRAYRVMQILRAAAAQAIFLETPDHAVVSTAVALAQDMRESAGYDKMVNAVARRICENGKTLIADLPPRIDTPGWLWRSFEKAYGPTGARALAKAHQREAPIDLTPKEKDDALAVADAVKGFVVGAGSVRLSARASVPSLPGYDDGRWWVQDAAAALPATLFGDIAGKRVYDLCAAPGGKTQQLAAAGARVTAVDQSGPRLKLIVDNLERTKLRVETIKEDVIRWTPEQKADAILLDAPCSATGTIRRHPDILWSKTPDDVAGLSRIQGQMLDHALSLLAPGGTLVYCVCSLQPEEGERQIEALLKKREDVTRAPIMADEVGDFAQAITRDGDIRTLPSMLAAEGGVDGFYVARLRLSDAN